MIHRLIIAVAAISALALTACVGGASKATIPPISPPTASGTPVSPPAFATAFNLYPPTPTVATVVTKRTQAAAAIPPQLQISGFSFVSAGEGWVLSGAPYLGGTQVLHTTDAGATWQSQYQAVNPIPSAIQFIDPMHGWVVGESGDAYCHNIDDPKAVASCSGAVLATADGGATWHLTTPSSLPLTAVAFVDANDGWALASTGNCVGCPRDTLAVLHTSDGGRTWKQTVLLDQPRRPDQPGIDVPEGYAAFGRLEAVSPSRALVVTSATAYMTADGGATWSKATSPCAQTSPPRAPGIAELATLPDGNAWATCRDFDGGGGMLESILYHSADGGSTWSLIADYDVLPANLPPGVGEFPGGVGDLQFLDDQRGWYASDDPGSAVYATSDGGHHWSRVETPLDAIPFVQFTDARDGFAATGYGGAARTTDGGAHWTQIQVPK